MSIVGKKKHEVPTSAAIWKIYSDEIPMVLIPKLGSWHKHKNGTKERGREHDLSSIVFGISRQPVLFKLGEQIWTNQGGWSIYKQKRSRIYLHKLI